MRFLLFNVAVVAALAYLFSMEREDLHVAADRLHDGLDTARSLAKEVTAPEAAPSTDETAWPNPDELPEPLPETQTAAIAEAPAKPQPAAPAPEVPVTQRAEAPAATASEAPPPSNAGLIDQLPPVSDPAVARRRAEVLEGLTPPPAVQRAAAAEAPELVLAEGQALMSDEERLKQLYVLAEEMELLFVQKLAK